MRGIMRDIGTCIRRHVDDILALLFIAGLMVGMVALRQILILIIKLTLM